jgi:hypothetical protein
MTSFNLYEAYAAVYDEDLREELLIEETILLESIDELNDDELEEIVEDSIYSMLDEGYDIDEVEEIFEETFSEARVDMAARIAQRKKEAAESEKSAKQARSKGASVVRKEKRAEAVGRIKGAVKKVASDIKSAAQKTAGDIKSGAKEAKFKAVDAPAARYASRRGIGGPAPGLAARAKDPEKRRALRGAVLKDIGSRAKAKLGRGIEKARSAGERAVGAVKSSSDATQAKAREAGSSAKAGAKGLVGRAARAVSRGARGVARRLGEDVDLYDIVLEHLLDEGFADTEEAATVIMANMSEEWRESIVDDIDEGYKKLPVGKMMRKVFSKAYNRGVENARNPDSKKGSEAFANSAKMTGVAKDHNPEASQERERQNRIRGGKR